MPTTLSIEEDGDMLSASLSVCDKDGKVERVITGTYPVLKAEIEGDARDRGHEMVLPELAKGPRP